MTPDSNCKQLLNDAHFLSNASATTYKSLQDAAASLLKASTLIARTHALLTHLLLLLQQLSANISTHLLPPLQSPVDGVPQQMPICLIWSLMLARRLAKTRVSPALTLFLMRSLTTTKLVVPLLHLQKHLTVSFHPMMLMPRPMCCGTGPASPSHGMVRPN